MVTFQSSNLQAGKSQNHTLKKLTSSGGSRKFWWGDFKHKPSKIRMSSPKLRVIFGPKSEIRTLFPPKIKWSPKKKKKVFTEIESDFSAEIGNSNVFSAQNQVVSKKKKKRSSPKLWVIFRPKPLALHWWGGCIPKWSRIFRNRGWFFGRNRYF